MRAYQFRRGGAEDFRGNVALVMAISPSHVGYIKIWEVSLRFQMYMDDGVDMRLPPRLRPA